MGKKTIEITLGKLMLIVLIIVVVIIVIVNIKNNNNDYNNDNNINSIEEQAEEEIVQEEVNTNIENTIWLFPAEYEHNLSKTSYKFSDENGNDLEGIEYTVDDISVPFINIDSADAAQINNEIKTIYQNLIKYFNEFANERVRSSYVKAEYASYLNEDMLSVVLTIEFGGTDVPQYQYYAYNFDLNTLEKATYEEVCAKTEIENVEERAVNAIRNYEGYSDGMDEYKDKSVDYYKQLVSNNNIKYFLDGNKKLNIVTTLYLPIGRGEFNRIINVQ